MKRLLALFAVLTLVGCASRPALDTPVYTQVVAADHPDASRAGAEILAQGGNAVDAAVATSFALSVVRPYSCGIGGGGFMVIYLPDDPTHGTVSTAINYRETAPGAVGSDYYEKLDDPLTSQFGGRAVAVPGTVAGLLTALDRYGTLDRATVLAPAIRLAEHGYTIDEHRMGAVEAVSERLHKHGWESRFAPLAQRFLHGVHEGDLATNPEQAEVLRRIAEFGRDGFYAGETAEAIIDAVRADGGDLSLDDLANYEPVEVEPLRFEIDGRTFLAMPPPSSGGITMAQALTIRELASERLDPFTPGERAHILVESLKHAFADRARWLGDPAFVAVPVAALLDPAYLAHRAAMINPDRTFPPERYAPDEPVAPIEDSGTSHFCVVDRFGGAVACTETINLRFGSLVCPPTLGFALNDEMDDFTTRPGEPNAFGLVQSERNLPEPGKRPLSSMSPTIVLDDDGEVLALAGASGGPRIITGTLQVLLDVLEADMGAVEAVSVPRLHHQWLPDAVYYEPAYDADVLLALHARGHELRQRPTVGECQLIRRSRDGRGWEAASDPRKGGQPAGAIAH